MITVPEGTKVVIERSRYLSEAISKDLINLSSLARYIKPELEEMLHKKINEASVVMALKRLKAQLKPQTKYKNVFKTTPEMIIHSQLSLITFTNSHQLNEKIMEISNLTGGKKRYFFCFTQGISETIVIMSNSLHQAFIKRLQEERTLYTCPNLSSITIQLPNSAINTSGVIYFLIKSLAWEGINIVEIVSAYLEFTLILKNEDLNRAFAVLRSIFKS